MKMGKIKAIKKKVNLKFYECINLFYQKIVMSTIHRRISSSTLIEVIVALLLANIVFFFSFSIVLNALGGNKMIKEYKSQLLANSYIIKEIEAKNFDNKSVEWESVNLKKQVISVTNKPGLHKMTIIITDKMGTKLAESKCFIRNE